MSVYQLTHRGRKLWCADLRGEGGKRHIKDGWLKRDAEDFHAKKLAELRAWGARGALSDEEHRELLMCRDQAAKIGVAIPEALKFWAAHNRAIVQKPIGEAVELYLGFQSMANCRDSYMHLLRQLRLLADHVGPDTPVNTITFDMVNKWASEHDWTLGTRYRRFGDVRYFFEWCKSPGTGEHWLVRNPMDDMPKIRLDHKTPVILTVDQCREFLNYVIKHDPGMLPFTVCRFFAGMRKEETERIFRMPHGMEPTVFKPDCIKIRDDVAKRTRARYNNRTIPLSDNPTLAAWLAAAPPVFPIDKPYRWDQIHQALKIPRNAVRHTAATFALHKWGEVKAAERLGHGVSMLHTKYKGELDDMQDVDRFWGLLPVMTPERKIIECSTTATTDPQ